VRRGIIVAGAMLLGVAAGVPLGLMLAPRLSKAPQQATPAPLRATPVAFADLPGWRDDTLSDVGQAVRESCRALATRPADALIGEGPLARPAAAWQAACAGLGSGDVAPTALREWLEAHFVPYAVSAGDDAPTGTFTGYYEAEFSASERRDARYRVPIYGPPRDLVTVDLPAFVPSPPAALPRQLVGRVVTTPRGQILTPYFTRAEIEQQDAIATQADVLIWADDPVAVHILHIQGSGRATLPDGRKLKVSFAGSNGQRFRGIGSILLAAGVLKPGGATMDTVRTWLQAHPNEAATYMAQNARYIFFKVAPDDDASGPIGALGVPLSPQRSLAVDPRAIPLGAPVWLATRTPDGAPFTRLMLAQDTGAAITGAVRGDVFWGRGEPAFAIAARMKSDGRYWVLLPRD
jgi:membrane-bound lytic murein transglycosylase A